jgi:hypothetical protein
VPEKHLGLLKGKIKIAKDFNTPLDVEVLALLKVR